MRPIMMSAMLGLPSFGVAPPKVATGIAAQALAIPSHRAAPRPSLDPPGPAQRREAPSSGVPAGPHAPFAVRPHGRQGRRMTAVRRHQVRSVADVCGDPAEVLALSITRFIAAGYATGDVACWDAAYSGAEHVLGQEPGGRLVASLTGLIRAIRAERSGGWMFMPASCCRVTADEEAIVRLLAIARDGDLRSIGRAAAAFAGSGSAPCTEAAARVAASVLDDVAAALPAQEPLRAAPRHLVH